tara:strand:+ start:42413 stop:43864 length:1452 start_codon:yes stop_codon:yes gene_type:complete
LHLSIFATEFPARPDIDKARFTAAAIAWIRGIKASRVLEEFDAKELYYDDAWLETNAGEALALKSYEHNSISAFGVRIEIPDHMGRKWRTECVYSRFADAAFLRIRGQCFAIEQHAVLETPKKPYFISQSIEDNWTASDGKLQIQSNPHYLQTNELSLAQAILTGHATEFLPCIYVSRNNDNSLPLDPNRLAKKIAGLGHIVVEPDRGFSFELMNASNRENPYAGAIGIFAPSGKQLSRLFRKADDRSGYKLETLCIFSVNSFMSGLAAKRGWEWQQIQEEQSRLLRGQISSESTDSFDEYIDYVDAELQAKDEQIENLKTLLEIAKASSSTETIDSSDLLPIALAKVIGRELYDGEFSDRLRFIIKKMAALQNLDVDERTSGFAQEFVKSTNFTGRAASLIAQIKAASKDGNEMPKKLGALLSAMGYSKTQEGKHLKFKAPGDLFGMADEVLPSTPSDSQRGGKNRGGDIIRHLGLSNLRGN